MLWYKGWLETRFRLLFISALMGFIVFFQYSHGTTPQSVHGIVLVSNPLLVLMAFTMLAGAGVVTQPTMAVSKGIHGSTLFTLSLPVSRLRLLGVRAGIGWLEAITMTVVFCCAFWFLSPALRTMATPANMFSYAATLVACSSPIYFLSVLLATFLDDQWRTWGTMMTTLAFWWLSFHTKFPASVDIVHGMGINSPLIAHTTPWNALGFSVVLAVVLFCVALRIVKAREY
jgi:hypothetical protein